VAPTTMAEGSSALNSSSNVTDATVAALEQRIVALEVGNQYDVNKEAIERVEMKHLQTLREIRTALLTEQSNYNGNIATMASSSSANGDPSIVEALKNENETLKKKIIKLEYRVQHLVSNMEMLYEKSTSI
jgi:hypothetical protein